MGFIRTKLLLLDQRYLPQVLPSQEVGDVQPAVAGLPLSARLATEGFRPEWATLPPGRT